MKLVIQLCYQEFLSLSLPGRLVPGSPAETCYLLHVDDELLAVNGQDVSQMDHSDIVSLIKSSGMSIHLTVQQPEPGGTYSSRVSMYMLID